MKTLIIGLGKSGKAAAQLLMQEGDDLYGYDDRSVVCEGVKMITEKEVGPYFDRAILSPGIPFTHPVIAKLKEVPLIGEIALGLQRLNAPVIGITGTNGKTTATALIAHLLSENNIPAIALGNIGTPLCEYLLNPDERRTVILELSSFQLEALTQKKLQKALLLNITPDHLDRYRSFEEYARAKCRIAQTLIPGGTLFICEETKKKFEKYFREIETVTFRGSGLEGAKELVRSLGVLEIEPAFASFKRPEHRLEFVRSLKGVRFVNDSKGTNVESVLYALSELSGKFIVIAGGRDKAGDFAKWRTPFHERVKAAVLYGEARDTISHALSGTCITECFPGFKEAVLRAYSLAQNGETVLLSPGCASFDLFQDYAERGRVFKEIVNQL